MTNINSLWDPLVLFQELFEQWPDLLERSRRLRTNNSDDPMTIRSAVIGFSLYYPIQGWSKANFEYIDSHLNGIAPLDTFSPEPACDEAHRVFACLGLGAILGQFNAGKISDEQAAKSEWILMGFLSHHNKAVCAAFHAAQSATE